ncbi:MAG: ABC transporter permease [Acidimicrobiia bacterium]
MKLALRELVRRPWRFAGPVATLTVLAFLLLFLGGLIDGLYLGSTGAIRAQDADVFTYSAASRDAFLRSRITGELRSAIEDADGVTATGGLGIALLGAAVPGETELADAAVIGYELPPTGVPEPPDAGTAWADERLEAFGVRDGDTLLLGPARTPITVVGFVKDTNYLMQGALWVDLPTWRDVQNANRPDSAVSEDVVQVVVARGDAAPAELAARIDAATADETSSLTKAEAELSLPGTKEQKSTFNAIIGTTYAVVVAIVALFFALITLERTPLYGVLKAIGASTRQLFAGVSLQAVVLTGISFAIGAALAFGLGAVTPPDFPLLLRSNRAVTTLLLLMVCSVVGSLTSLRRVIRIDAATSIGTGI